MRSDYAHPRVAAVFEFVDERILRHGAGCAILNHTVCLGYVENEDRFRLEFPNPFYRVWRWAVGL